jgi:hypothetical protein
MQLKSILIFLLLVGSTFAETTKPILTQPVISKSSPVLLKLDREELRNIIKDLNFQIIEENEKYLLISFNDYRAGLFIPNDTSLQFYASFNLEKPRPELVNKWNQKMRYSRAYTDPEGRTILESDLDLNGGVTSDNVKEFIKKFQLLLSQFGSNLMMQD